MHRLAKAGCGIDQHIAQRILMQANGIGILQNLETGRNIGLKGCRLQKPGTKAMNRVDFQPTRRFKRQGKQGAGARADAGWRDEARKVCKPCHEFVIRDRRPFAQIAEQADFHVGRRRLGVSQANNAGGRNTSQKQP